MLGVGIGVGVGVGIGVGVGVVGIEVEVAIAVVAWEMTSTTLVRSRGFCVVVSTKPLASCRSSCFCSSKTIKSKLASGLSKPVKKSDLFTSFPMSKFSTFEKLLPSVVTIFPGPTSTD